jgi:poly(A) polymerase
VILAATQHDLLEKNISKNALAVLKQLQQAGYQAYLVGGSVRDLLLGMRPKDFDIATDAHPEKIRRLFRNSRLIGKRFRLVHVFFGREIIEVSTFRAHHPEQAHPEGHASNTGMLLRDNIFGSIEDDAWRRDFTINALYYNAADATVIDYTNGMQDLRNKSIRILGDPISRYKEDPVRMLRAIRLAAKLSFSLEAETGKHLYDLKDELKHVSNARMFDVVLKLFYCGHAVIAFNMLRQYGFFGLLFPQTEAMLKLPAETEKTLALILQSCRNTDLRIANEQSLNPAFLFATLLWPPVQHRKQQFKEEEGHRGFHALQLATHKVIRKQTQTIAIPRRYTAIIEEIWAMQHLLEEHPKRRIFAIFSQPRFRAAYDFLLLRFEAGETNLKKAVMWWQEFQTLTAEQREEKVAQL